MSKKQTPESFWSRVDRGGPDECWPWLGGTNNTGYGTVGWHGRNFTAHRVAAWLSGMVDTLGRPTHSRIPGHVLHKCDNRKCCNPNHFFIGTYADNQKDAYSKGRRTQPKGAVHINAKLTSTEAEEIRRRYAQGAFQVPLAKEYGVSQTVISLIVRGKSYKCKS